MELIAKLTSHSGTWRQVADLARATIGMEPGDGEPSSRWKVNMLLAEHSPIRLLTFNVLLINVPYWVSVHLTRHKIGVEHFVKTQRSDRTGVPRSELPQGALVNHAMVLNAQAVITMSRKRLCRCASTETTLAWKAVLEAIKPVCQELYNVCVPECVYRGFCPEIKSCGFTDGRLFTEKRLSYIESKRK